MDISNNELNCLQNSKLSDALQKKIIDARRVVREKFILGVRK